MRKYVAHLPTGEFPAAGWPVVLCFHGGGSNPSQMVDFTGLSEAADRHRFVAAYPAGTGLIEAALTWNAGNCCGRAWKQNVDEVAFVTALLDDLPGRFPVDARRIFATGMSNGGMLCYLLADRLSQRIAAIAPVAGVMGEPDCAPRRPVPVLHFHGLSDEFVPFGGGVGRKSISKTNFHSVQHAIDQWVRANGCQPAPEVREVHSEDAPGVVRIARYVAREGFPGSQECPPDQVGAGVEVILYALEGVGHVWPGRESRFKALGTTTKFPMATEVMWEFFARHPLP